MLAMKGKKCIAIASDLRLGTTFHSHVGMLTAKLAFLETVFRNAKPPRHGRLYESVPFGNKDVCWPRRIRWRRYPSVSSESIRHH